MAGIIKGRCEQDSPYTGRSRCAKSEGTTRALILTDLAARYPIEEKAFIDGLQGFVNTTGLNRMYPVKGIQNVTASGGDVETSDVGFSGEIPVGLNSFSEVYQIKGDDCLLKELIKLNKREMRVFRVDDEQYIYGTVRTINNVEYFTGYLATIMVYEARANDTDSKSIYIAVYYSADNETENKNKNAFYVGDIPDGLIPVVLEAVSGGVKVVHTCSGSDYTQAYGEEWTNADLFISDKGAKPTTVTFDAKTGLLTITPEGDYRVQSASYLEEGGIFDLEGVAEFVTV